GKSAVVSWDAKQQSEVLADTKFTYPANVSMEANILPASFATTPNPDGTVTARLDNQGQTAIIYSGLHFVAGANAAFYTPDQFVAGMATGNPVSLLIPSSGT